MDPGVGIIRHQTVGSFPTRLVCPLHQKVNAFLEFANDPAINLDITVNDPGNGIAYILLPTGTGATAQ